MDANPLLILSVKHVSMEQPDAAKYAAKPEGVAWGRFEMKVEQ